MSAQDTPRAFPSSAIDDDFSGMSMRDYFAGQVVASIADDFAPPASIAIRAYAIADAMMAERDVKS